MKHVLSAALCLALTSCAGPQKPPPCSADDVARVRLLYKRAARDAIERGECDANRTLECPALKQIRSDFDRVTKKLCEVE